MIGCHPIGTSPIAVMMPPPVTITPPTGPTETIRNLIDLGYTQGEPINYSFTQSDKKNMPLTQDEQITF